MASDEYPLIRGHLHAADFIFLRRPAPRTRPVFEHLGLTDVKRVRPEELSLRQPVAFTVKQPTWFHWCDSFRYDLFHTRDRDARLHQLASVADLFCFTLGDIETGLRHGTPYVAVVASDSAWGIVAECYAEDCRCGSALGDIRFDRVAEALGARGVYIEHGSQLPEAIEEGLGLDTVTFIHVPIQLGGIDYWDSRLSQ